MDCADGFHFPALAILLLRYSNNVGEPLLLRPVPPGQHCLAAFVGAGVLDDTHIRRGHSLFAANSLESRSGSEVGAIT